MGMIEGEKEEQGGEERKRGRGNYSPGQNICVDSDKQERNPPNLGLQVPAKQTRLSKILKQCYEEL